MKAQLSLGSGNSRRGVCLEWYAQTAYSKIQPLHHSFFLDSGQISPPVCLTKCANVLGKELACKLHLASDHPQHKQVVASTSVTSAGQEAQNRDHLKSFCSLAVNSQALDGKQFPGSVKEHKETNLLTTVMFSKVPWRLGIINSTLTFAKLYPQPHEIPREQANRPSQSKQMLHFGCCITWTATLLVWSTNPHESRVGTALGAHTRLLNQTRTHEGTAQGLSCSHGASVLTTCWTSPPAATGPTREVGNQPWHWSCQAKHRQGYSCVTPWPGTFWCILM